MKAQVFKKITWEGDKLILECRDNKDAYEVYERLKAWRILRGKGFRFNKWTIPEEPKTPHIKLVLEAEMDVPDSPYDLDLLFGGEK